MPLIKIIPDKTNFKFMNIKKITLLFSTLFFLMSLFFVFFKGLNFGIDFTGGILIEARFNDEKINLNNIRKELNNLDLGEIQLQNINNTNDLAIRVQRQKGNEQNQLTAIKQIKDNFSSKIPPKTSKRGAGHIVFASHARRVGRMWRTPSKD